MATAERRAAARCITHSVKLSIAAMAICVEVSKAKRQLSKLMDASMRGEEVILQEAGVALVKLVPVAKAAADKSPSGQ
jgi:prevent-host-death family protein